MAHFCWKCGMLKITLKGKCACTIKEKKETNKWINKISPKKALRLKEQGSEKSLFEKIFKFRLTNKSNMCEVCGVVVSEPTPSCFPHILAKGQFPALRMFENNIGFVCGIECHQKFDEAVVSYKRQKGVKYVTELIMNKKRIKNLISFL